MQEQEQHSKYSDLISSYLSGNASDMEVRELEAWVLAAPENKQQFIANKKTWMLSGMKQNKQPVNVEQFWKETSRKLFKEAQVVGISQKRSRRSGRRTAVRRNALVRNFCTRNPALRRGRSFRNRRRGRVWCCGDCASACSIATRCPSGLRAHRGSRCSCRKEH